MAKSNEIQDRSYGFALRIVRLHKFLENNDCPKSIANQLLRSGTSIGANVEEAIGAQSKKDFIFKMTIALKESRETFYWLRLLRDSDSLSREKIGEIIDESEQIIKIISKIIITSQKNT